MHACVKNYNMSFESAIQNVSPDLQQVAQTLRKLILQTDKRIEENIYGGAKVKTVLYSIVGSNNVLYGIGTGKDHIKLYLHHTDKDGVSTDGLKLEGKGKHARTVKISQIDNDYRQHLIEAFKSILRGSGY